MNFKITSLFVAALFCTVNIAHTQGLQPKQDTTPAESQIEHSTGTPISQEFESSYSYTAPSQLRQGNAKIGNLESMNSNLKYVISRNITDGVILRTGIAWERFDFGTSSASAPIPNTLQSTSLVLGADTAISDQWIMRTDIMPGVYSDFEDISIDDFNIPAVVGFSYIVDKDLQWFFGLMANPRAQYPIIPGVGVRWKFADQWTLMAVLPNPRIEYNLNKTLTLFTGISLKSGDYNVSRNFGSKNFGRTDLNNDHVEYTEARVGAGAAWQFHPAIKLEAETGATVYRRLEYRQSDLSLHTSDPAPYGQIGITANF